MNGIPCPDEEDEGGDFSVKEVVDRLSPTSTVIWLVQQFVQTFLEHRGQVVFFFPQNPFNASLHVVNIRYVTKFFSDNNDIILSHRVSTYLHLYLLYRHLSYWGVIFSEKWKGLEQWHHFQGKMKANRL